MTKLLRTGGRSDLKKPDGRKKKVGSGIVSKRKGRRNKQTVIAEALLTLGGTADQVARQAAERIHCLEVELQRYKAELVMMTHAFKPPVKGP